MSPQGPQGPENGQGNLFWGVPFGTQICLHFCFQIQIFFIEKKTIFKDLTLIKNGAQKVQNRIRKHIQNFARLLIAFWLPKCPPKPPKIEQTGVQNTYVFCVRVSNVISPFFERFFDGCSRRQTLVSTAIYTTFVGWHIFRQVRKCIVKRLPK